MAAFDMKSDISVTGAAALTVTTAAVNGQYVDMQGWEALTVAAHMGAISNAGSGVSFKLQHSDAVGTGTFEDCSADEVIGSVPAIDNTDQENLTRGTIGYRGNKRYVRLVATGSASANAIVTPVYIQGRKTTSRPVAAVGTATTAS
jgi:hypothetical protein